MKKNNKLKVKILNIEELLKIADEPTINFYSVALGNFDGIHLGHQAVIKQCGKVGKILNRKKIGKFSSVVLTFFPHPSKFIATAKGEKSPHASIIDNKEKIKQIAKLGIDQIWLLNFDQQLANTTPEDFIKILVKLGVRYIVTGENFHFGKGRSGNSQLLQKISLNQKFPSPLFNNYKKSWIKKNYLSILDCFFYRNKMEEKIGNIDNIKNDKNIKSKNNKIIVQKNYNHSNNNQYNQNITENSLIPYNFFYQAITSVNCNKGEIISSSRIRKEINMGNVQQFKKFTKRAYHCDLVVYISSQTVVKNNFKHEIKPSNQEGYELNNNKKEIKNINIDQKNKNYNNKRDKLTVSIILSSKIIEEKTTPTYSINYGQKKENFKKNEPRNTTVIAQLLAEKIYPQEKKCFFCQLSIDYLNLISSIQQQITLLKKENQNLYQQRLIQSLPKILRKIKRVLKMDRKTSRIKNRKNNNSWEISTAEILFTQNQAEITIDKKTVQIINNIAQEINNIATEIITQPSQFLK